MPVICLLDNETKEDCIIPAAGRLKEGMVAVELGTFLGGSICLLANNLREPNIKVYAIDNWICDNISYESLQLGNLTAHNEVYDKFMENLKNEKLDTIVTPIKSDTTLAASLFADKSVNYLFFDANHDFAELKAELLAWKDKMADNCFAFVHDFYADKIRDAVHEVFGRDNIKVVRGGASAIIKDTL